MMFEAVFAMMRDDRARYHLTLGEVILLAKQCKPSALVLFNDGDAPAGLTSYRGYYEDLGITTRPSKDQPTTAEPFLKECRLALKETFYGWKGGKYRMDKKTPLWRAQHGETGDPIVRGEIDRAGNLILFTAPEKPG